MNITKTPCALFWHAHKNLITQGVDAGRSPPDLRRVEPLSYGHGYRPTRFAFVIYNVDETKRQRIH